MLGRTRLLLHWWRDTQGIQMEIMEQDVKNLEDPMPLNGPTAEDVLQEELDLIWIPDYDFFSTYVQEQESDEGFVDVNAVIGITVSYDSQTGETDSDIDFSEVQCVTLTEDEFKKLNEEWPGVKETNDE